MISNEYRKYFNENGYLVVENLLSKDQVKQGVDAIDEILNSENAVKAYEMEPGDQSTVRRIWSPTAKHQTFEKMAAEPKLLDIIESLIGKDIMFHYSKLNMKGPKVGSVVEWHQDFSYYPHTNSDLLTALIFLDDATIENGCLRVVPGSNKNGLASHEVDGFFRGKVSNVNETNAIHLEVPAGSVVFLHCLTLHASAINQSAKSRRTFLPAYRAADALPIYFGPHAAHNESGVKILRGTRAKMSRVEEGVYLLPIAEREFGSIYDIQEGSHLKKDLSAMQTTGYAVTDA